MEGEKYNLGKAQEEAEKLRKKVETGNASNYGEAEKLVEQETKKREAIASQIGLKADSKLVEVLGVLDKDQIDKILSSLSQEIHQTFAPSSDKLDGNYQETAMAEILKSLSHPALAGRIKTLEDFERYAKKILEIETAFIQGRDEQGLVNRADVEGVSSYVVESAVQLMRGNFDEDLETIAGILRDGGKTSSYDNILKVLNESSYGAFRSFIRSSDDLKRFHQFVKTLSENGFQPKEILEGELISHVGKFSFFGINMNEEEAAQKWEKRGKNEATAAARRFQEWSSIITDSTKLDEVLGVMEALIKERKDPTDFVSGIGKTLFSENANPEQLKQILSSLSQEIHQTFAPSSDKLDGNYQETAMAEILKSLSHPALAGRIKTLEDFERYAKKILEIETAFIQGRDEQGLVNRADVEGVSSYVVESAVQLMRGNFDEDLETIAGILRDGGKTSSYDNILKVLNESSYGAFRSFIRSSDDLKRFHQFVKTLSENGFQPKEILEGELISHVGKFSFFGINMNEEEAAQKWEKRGKNEATAAARRFQEWSSIITDSTKLDEVLGVMEAAFAYGEKPNDFVRKVNQMPTHERGDFIQLAKNFAVKDIPPQFVADNLPLLENCDFSKDGLAVFTSFEAQKKWLEYCVKVWKQNPQNIENLAKFFNEALSSEIKTTSKKEYKVGNIKGLSIDDLADIQENVDEELGSAKEIIKPNEKLRVYASKLLQSALSELYENKNFEAIAKIQESVGGSAEAVSALDQAKANALTQNDLIKFIPSLGGAEAGEIFPLTFGKAKEMIFSKLATDQDLADYFVENLDKYYQQPWVAENVAKAIKQYSVAQKFIYAVENYQTTWKNEAWVVDVFAKAKVIVEEQQKQFDQDDGGQDSYGYSHGNEGFSETDPFENHPWCFGGRQIRIASAISELMAGKVNNQSLEELGINSEEISPLLAEANEKVNIAYQNFLEQINSNPNIKDDDKQAFLNPESSSVKMTPLLNNIRSFVARYFVQSIEGDVTRLSEIGNLSGELDRILTEGFKRYIKIHEVDVPLYDKLYEEFDNLRETGRSPLEVYLGRDGIYAYIGRHSQDVARRRKLGLEGRKKLKEMGEVVEIHPQYTVYPRYFRDNLNQETKRQFLEQEGISPDADPLFYDTGYTGTIPEQIMKVMDFSQEDIERRIRLLSAPSVHRRVKGIPENARSEIIEYIEHNAKTEETAEGLMIDEKTGKIRHIARPTNPEEQFYFMMVKQAVARHYWLQEQLHHEPSGNVNLDSEHYTIRIRQEYAKLLPPEFMQNPKEFLTQHSELLKGSKGEGEYPDEEVVLFKMTDETEIVAKKIELRKAKEARKEFFILISAKKAGLPTAEPVGFLSGKEESDGSYLLMKKLEGISGRNFDKYLRDTGKFTEEKIKSILQQVAEKNKEMAELFRTTLKIDKRWRIKDTIIELNEETGEVESVVPIDWERAQNFNPATPKEIDEIA